ncbi:MAG TPA: ABC transporter substrate-binding protein, partial [Steroidobacteraceae bacterium]|nr:ABC transporter substrate-binding protein [Steroidobacteraceae bacterium]
LTLDECLYAREGGVDVRVILVFDYSAGGDVIMSRPDIRKLEDLMGRRIGVDETAAGALMLAKTLEAAGLAPGEVEKVRVTANYQLWAYEAGEVDALVSWEPIATQLEAAGARRLFDSTAYPGLIVDVLAARADALESSPASFRKLLAGYFKALDYLRSAPDDAIRRMAPRMGVSPSQVRSAQRGIRFIERAANRDWLDGASPGLINAAGNVGRIMSAAGLLRRAPVLDGLADPRFLPGAA